MSRLGIMVVVAGVLLAHSEFGQRAAAPRKPFVYVAPESMQRHLIRKVPPEYPDLARQRHIHGVVTLEIRVSAKGRVTAARTISGHPLLIDAALEAVRHWTYHPVLQGGVPVDAVSTVAVSFPPYTGSSRD